MEGKILLAEELCSPHLKDNTIIIAVSKIGIQVADILRKYDQNRLGICDIETIENADLILLKKLKTDVHLNALIIVDVIATAHSISNVLNTIHARAPQLPVHVTAVLDIRPVGAPIDLLPLNNRIWKLFF